MGDPVEAFYEQLLLRAATIDEVLSDTFVPGSGRKGDTEIAARRLAAWCRSASSGDWTLFERRLQRDGLSIGAVLTKFGTVRRDASAPVPAWLDDAIWVEAALHRASPAHAGSSAEPRAFEHLLTPVVAEADTRLWASVPASAADNVLPSAVADLRLALLSELSALLAPALYELFAEERAYQQFVMDMKLGGFRSLFTEKPVLLRVIATLTRQWIDSARDLVSRLEADLASIRRDLLQSETAGRVIRLTGGLSDPHNQGRTVHIVGFEDDSRIVYKPKDVRVDTAWHALVGRLNDAGAPVELKAVRTIARDGYGWTEFIDHAGCTDTDGCQRFFRRAGAWLALFHCFASTDMHHENMIAAGEHPVPIDLEMALQAPTEQHSVQSEAERAFETASDKVANSVIAVGLLPSYGRSPDNSIFAVGGVTSERAARMRLAWTDINSDSMRPARTSEVDRYVPNLPHVAGRRASLDDHLDDFVGGFEDYTRFLVRRNGNAGHDDMFDGFAGLPIRAVVRPTRFYGMLLQRLKDHRQMHDGIGWSAQAEFIARLADWDAESDPLWPLQRAERAAFVELNVPRFVAPSDGTAVSDRVGIVVQADSLPGLDRARARVGNLDEQEIAWQVEVIRQSTIAALPTMRIANAPDSEVPQALLRTDTSPTRRELIAQTNALADELSRYAVRDGPGAAWIGLDWLGDADVSQLVALGRDLYGGVCGIAVFLAAHAAVTGHQPSEELARAALGAVRNELRGNNSARLARSLGIGAGMGVGSIVYALAVVAELLGDGELLADAQVAAGLMTPDLIAADNQLDVVGGGAGAILALLRMYRQTGSADSLDRAAECGRHLLRQPRHGADGARSWKGQGPGPQPLNGMSHGAAGFAYALTALASATGHTEFADAAAECIAFENSTFDPGRGNWPDLRFVPNVQWPSQWCHGATGIGIARIASLRQGVLPGEVLERDVRSAVAAAEQTWPGKSDMMCCGTLGNVEFLREASGVVGRPELNDLAARRLKAVLDAAAFTGDFRWTGGERRFNLGLFRGLAGVGYTALRQVEVSLPNILMFQ